MPDPLAIETATLPEKRWSVGTLSYTSGGLIILFGWLLWGDFAWQMKERSVQPVVQVMLKKLGASDLATGLLLGSLPAVLALVLSPLASYKSDRHRGRWGRRIPYLLAPTPFVVATMLLLAASPWLGERLDAFLGMRSPGPQSCALVLFGFSWILFEVGTLVANAIFGALINDVVPREMLGRFFGLFRACSLLAGILFNRYVFGVSDTHYVEIFAGVALLYGAGFTLMCMKVKEGEYPPPAPPDPHRPPGFIGAIKVYFHECYSNPYYLWVFTVLALITTAFLPINLYSVYYAESVGMSKQSYGNHLALTYAISLFLAYLLGVLVDRFHPLRMGIVAIALYIAVMIWGGIMATTPERFGIAFVAHGVLSGMYFTCTASIGQRLYPRHRFAQFNSAALMVAGLGGTVTPIVLGSALDWAGRDYRQTFFWGAALGLLGLGGLCVVHAKWQNLGGKTHYQAPE